MQLFLRLADRQPRDLIVWDSKDKIFTIQRSRYESYADQISCVVACSWSIDSACHIVIELAKMKRARQKNIMEDYFCRT